MDGHAFTLAGATLIDPPSGAPYRERWSRNFGPVVWQPMVHRRFPTPTKAINLPALSSPMCWKRLRSRYPWTGVDAGSTTVWSSGFGGHWNMHASIWMSSRPVLRSAEASVRGSNITMKNDRTHPMACW